MHHLNETVLKAVKRKSQVTGDYNRLLLWSLGAMFFLIPEMAVGDHHNRYQISIGSMVFSDVSVTSDDDYQGASFSVPLSFSIRRHSFRWTLASAYLTQSQDNTTRSGSGDTRLGMAYDVNHWLSLGYKHKFATGSESKGFSTGDDDDDLYLDLFHPLSSSTSLFATLGYKWVGDGGRSDRRNAGHVAVGLGYLFSPDFSFLVSADHYQSSYTSSDDVNALTAMATHKLNHAYSLSWYVNGDSSDAFSAGSSLNYSF